MATFLEKLQKLPITTRKIILWAAVIIIGITFLAFWAKGFQQKLRNFQSANIQDQLKIPSMEEKDLQMPKSEAPKISQEDLKKIEEGFKKAK